MDQVEIELVNEFEAKRNASSDILGSTTKTVWCHVEAEISDKIYGLIQCQIFSQVQNVMCHTFKKREITISRGEWIQAGKQIGHRIAQKK